MNNNQYSSFQIIVGTTILVIFSYVAIINILPNSSTNKYLASNNNHINASIIDTQIEHGILNVKTEGNALKGCIKTTKTTPKKNDFCWIKIENNSFSSSIYKNKKYYIWIMDNNEKISNIYENE